MNAIVVYVGAVSRQNFDHGIARGIWGFKANRRPKGNVEPGDLIVFGQGAIGVGPQAPQASWLTASLTEVVIGLVTEGIRREENPEWPDEVNGQVIYPHRLRFSVLRRIRGPVPIADTNQIPPYIAESLRLSGSAKTGKIVPYTGGLQGIEQVAPRTAEAVPPVEAPTTQPLTEDRKPESILADVCNFITTRGFSFPSTVISNLYASLRAKPFAILGGNSGTGKSRLARLFAEAIGANVGNGRFQMIAVRPDWNDGSDLLGYFDLNGDYRPGQLIATLLRANANPDKPYFVCLDEMNLARVEHYFSDFLSIIESRRRENGTVVTDPVLREEHIRKMKPDSLPGDVAAILETMQRTPRAIGLPPNLYMIGTVNMDETTQPFSRKVLDRANTLEFNEIDLEEGLTDERSETPVPPLDLSCGFLANEFTSLKDVSGKHRETAAKVASFLQNLNASLDLAGFEVGYRVRDEAIAFTIYALGAGMSEEETKQNIVLQKVLPRVQGSSPRIETALISLMKHLAVDEEVPEKEATDFTDRLAQLHTRADVSPVLRKLAGMLLIFREEGFTSFWLA